MTAKTSATAAGRLSPLSPRRLSISRPVAITAAVAVVAVWALISGWWTPRGPLTPAEALSDIGISLLVGLAAGAVSRSRWAMVLGPVVFAATFEIVRVATDGPMVDGFHLSEYGVFAMVMGRGFHGLVAIVPMVLGASYGAALARRRDGAAASGTRTRRHRAGLILRRGVAALTAVGLAVLAYGIALPGVTSTITDAAGNALAGSIAELTRVPIGGHDLSMMIRGDSTTRPVLLMLAGGPGGTELGAMRHHGQLLEHDFVVVTLDQRGTGTSYDQLDPTSTLTLQAAVDDTIEVTNYLRSRFNHDKVYLLGQSWGTLLGVLAVQQRPELYAAYIGSGQMVDPRQTDQITYRDTVAWARRQGNTSLVDTLIASGPPPYADVLDYEPALAHESDVYPYDHTGNAEGRGQMSEGIFVPEYSLIDKIHNIAGFLDTFPVLYPQLQQLDLRVATPRLAVPVYLFQGAHEATSRSVLADQWFALVQAPHKERATGETSGHRALWEQPQEFAAFMTGTVLAQTQKVT